MILRNRFIRYWLPVCILCAGIFIQSSFAMPDLKPDWPFLDKAAHIIMYAALSILIFRAFNRLKHWQRRYLLSAATVVVLATLYGLSDEWHQSFVVGRSADAFDLLADLIGSLLGAMVFIAFIYLRNGFQEPDDPIHLP